MQNFGRQNAKSSCCGLIGVRRDQLVRREVFAAFARDLDEASPVFHRDRISPLHLGHATGADTELAADSSVSAKVFDDLLKAAHDTTNQHIKCQYVNIIRVVNSDSVVGMSGMSERLRQAREKAGFESASAAAAAVGVNPSTYRAHENGQNEFSAGYAGRYGKRFGVSASWLLTGEGNGPTATKLDDPDRALSNLPRPMPNASPPVPVDFPARRLPMYGAAIGGADGRFVLNGNKVADALCPPQLADVPDAYGVFVVGTSMEPRYFAGEAVFLHPHLPVRQGDFVVVQLLGADEGEQVEGYVKRFVSMNAKELVLEQYEDREGIDENAPLNDRRRLKFPRSRVAAVHKIVQSGIA